MADNSQATPEKDTAGIVDTNPSDVPETTSDGSTVTQENGKEFNGEDIVFGTVQPDTLAEEESAPPTQEKSAPVAEEEPARPAKEKSAPPAQEKSARLAEEESTRPAEEESAPLAEEEPARPVEEESAPPAEEEPAPLAEEELPPPAEEERPPPAEEECPLPAEEERPLPAEEELPPPAEEVVPPPAVEELPLAADETPSAEEESDSAPSETRTTTELNRVAAQIVPHLINLYNSSPTAHDYDIYAPDATFEDPLMRAHGVAQIKSAFYTLPKVFLDSTLLQYAVVEEKISPGSGEILIDNLQQYKLLQLGPIGYYVTMRSLIKLTVERGKVVRHEDLWGGYALWNRDTVWVPLVGRLAETVRRGNMLVTHVLMGFGKDHKTLDKDSSFHLKVA